MSLADAKLDDVADFLNRTPDVLDNDQIKDVLINLCRRVSFIQLVLEEEQRA